MREPKFTFPIGVEISGTRLTPLRLVKLAKKQGSNFAYECACSCGKSTVQPISGIRRGRIKSCGCAWADRRPPYTDVEFKKAFFEKVKKSGADKCWNWLAYVNDDGYGIVGFKGKSIGAHRASWWIRHGVLPKRPICVLHSCDNPRCVNPNHLWLGTQADNVIDCARKGRIRLGDRRGEKSPISPFKNADVLEIRRLAKHMTCTAISKKYKVCRQSIDAIVHRRTWTHI